MGLLPVIVQPSWLNKLSTLCEHVETVFSDYRSGFAALSGTGATVPERLPGRRKGAITLP